ncbi:IS110 family transposase [Massilia sp. RP-1-19]|uniref:IS110 family transposase n=1 Tax=Massilia polaris TaxID=2728846 RepID=A0A848HI10_9BURK|nr:IS110 family transposase [Massilia polaris]NML60662.1 IS110 family transposase [Massilia polaris]
MNTTTKMCVGVDTAKDVFQLHWVERETGEVRNKALKRDKFLEHFANLSSSIVGMEACGGSHHWARRLMAMGHEVKLLSGRFVKAFAPGNKNDAADARAIWLAMQQPGIRTVAVKTEEQQSVLAMHRMREQLIKFRTAQTNGLRGLMAEYGEVMKRGRAAMNEQMPAVLERLSKRLPGLLIDTLRAQWNRIAVIDGDIKQIEVRLQAWMKVDESCQAIAAIPGVGLLTATAAVATMGNANAFKSGREFAAWIGLVPAQNGTGGRVKLLGISKRGDTYLRTLLIHGARSALLHSKEPSAWTQEMRKRRPLNVVVVALANKMARMIWAILAHGRAYDKQHVSSRPA